MKSSRITTVSIILALGTVLQLASLFMMGFKPDIMLLALCFSIIAVPEKHSVFCAMVISAIISALITVSPYGQIPCMLDKITAAIVFYTLLSSNKGMSRNNVCMFVILLITAITSSMAFMSTILLLIGQVSYDTISMALEVAIPLSVMTAVVGIMIIIISKRYKDIRII